MGLLYSATPRSADGEGFSGNRLSSSPSPPPPLSPWAAHRPCIDILANSALNAENRRSTDFARKDPLLPSPFFFSRRKTGSTDLPTSAADLGNRREGKLYHDCCTFPFFFFFLFSLAPTSRIAT